MTAENFIQQSGGKNYLGAGCRSVCYVENDEVTKYIPYSALSTFESIVDEYELIHSYLQDSVLETRFSKYSDYRNVEAIIARQIFFDGKRLFSVIENHPTQNQLEAIISFLNKCLGMYEACRQIPDIFGRPHGMGWYRPLTTPNALIISSAEHPVVKLVDVNFSRLSKLPAVGYVHNKLLSLGIKRAIYTIQNRL